MEGDEYFNLEEEPSDWSGKLKFSHLCRVCANPNGYLIPIFEGEGLDHELGMKIQKHLPIQVFEIDSLPKQMCYQCASTLIAWHDLTIGCIEADKKLRQLQCEKQQEQQQSQVQDSEDDKVTEFFDTPSVEPENIEPEKSDVTITQSRTAAESSPSLQTQVEKKIPCTKKKRRVMEKPSKVKMVLLRGPTAGPSRHLTATKSQSTKALDIVKAKGGTTQEFGTTERSHEQFHSATVRNVEDLEGKQSTSNICIKRMGNSDRVCNLNDTTESNCDRNSLAIEQHFYSIYIKTEDESEYYLCDVKEVENALQISESDCLTNFSVGVPTESNYFDQDENSLRDSNDNSSMVCNRIELCDHNYVQLNNEDSSVDLSLLPSESLVTTKQSLESTVLPRTANEIVHDFNANKPYILKCITSQLRKPGGKCRSKSVSINRLVSCKYCTKAFRSMAVLQTHTRIHTNVTPFYCKYCGRSFHLASSLKQHLLICKETGSRNTVYSHPLTIGNDNHFACTICGKIYKLKPSLKEHLRAHMGKARLKLKCEVCGKKFLKKADIVKHMSSHENLVLFSCETCHKGFISEKDLQDHLISHSDVRPFVCTICGATYKRKSHLTRHILNHSANRKHIRTTHMRRQPGETFMCEICSKITTTKRLLMLHMISHTGERNHECSICGKRFAQSGAMSRHIHTVHGGAKDFTCDICNQSFTAKATRENHMRIHTGEKPYQCTVCGKTFRTQQQHRLHEKIHSDARPFPCPYCSKCFRRRPHLVVHIRTHTGEKPFACPLCGRCFAQKNDMTKHLNIHNR